MHNVWLLSISFSDPQHANLLGCYADFNPRDLWGYQTPLDGTVNSSITCVAVCASKGYPFAAVHSYSSCYCGVSYGRYGKAAVASDCNSQCEGVKMDNCSKKRSNSVYRTGERRLCMNLFMYVCMYVCMYACM